MNKNLLLGIAGIATAAAVAIPTAAFVASSNPPTVNGHLSDASVSVAPTPAPTPSVAPVVAPVPAPAVVAVSPVPTKSASAKPIQKAAPVQPTSPSTSAAPVVTQGRWTYVRYDGFTLTITKADCSAANQPQPPVAPTPPPSGQPDGHWTCTLA